MRNRFIELTSGWIPVSVMLLLATVLVAGQPDAEQRPESSPLPDTSISVERLLDANDRARLASIRHFVDAVLPVPETVQVTIDVSVYPAGEDVPAPTDLLE